MTTCTRFAAPLGLATFALFVVGCSKQPAPAPAPPKAVVEEEVVEEVEVPAVEDATGAAAPATDAAPATETAPATDAAPAATDSTAAPTSDDVTAAFASLSEGDRTAALAQKICPVSDEPLGSMGTPLKVTVEGRDVFLCCEGCKKSLEADPQKYLAKLDAPK